ncbi:rho guanine nucleotide exchange factor 2 [Panthera uncia]|uniref:rho guanine nucleotide exchange factor 2 n=1 Tax=Panthera uncia TaxID=29064 RepID=UPI0020FFA6E5|nr:rho guanine nucleotide exchange factor 2 [Panthera uncia]
MQTGLRVPPMSGDFPKEFLAGGDLVPRGHSRRCLSVDESRAQLEEEEEEEEEEQEQEGKKKEGDGFHAVPLRRSGAFRAHSHHPFKRHSWGPDRDLQDPLSRSKLQTSGCTCPQEPPLLRSREELDAFLEWQHQGGRPSRVGQSCCHPPVGPLDRSATGTLSKSASMSGISCLLGCSDPAGNLCQPSATDLSRSCSQLEGGSGTWADSPLRRTLSFLLGMTGKAKVGVSGEAGGLAPLPSSVPLLCTPPSALSPASPGDRHPGQWFRLGGSTWYFSQTPSLHGGRVTFPVRPPASSSAASCGQLGEGKGRVHTTCVPTELIQTELHHVRTLKIMTRLFRTGMLEELQLEPGVVQGLFPCVDELSDIHTRFLGQLLERRRQALCPGSTRNFVIHRLGDLLISQFSGASAEQMRKTYSEFCSRHTKALKLYKELYARDKRFQQFIRKVTRSAVLKRHGVQECVLLVTQRITKYPVLINRILQHSHGTEEERQDLSTALGLVKELLSNVDQDVHELEKGARLQEIYHRMDPRAQTPVPGKGPFGREELLRRRLIHDGCLLWKTATGRFKDVLMLLMTDVLVFLQEKDQKYIFPALDKPSVVSLQNLIVRDIANQEKGMFLISAAPPEMYEVHTASRDDRSTWIRVIQQSVRVCPSREDFPLIETEDEAYLRRIKTELRQKDRALAELLQEKVGLFAEMTHFQVEDDGGGVTLPTLPRGLFRSESLECPRGERLLQDAIREVEGLKDLLVGPGVELLLTPREPALPVDPDSGGSTSPGVTANGEARTFNGSIELCRADSDSSQKDRNGNQLRAPQEEALQRLVNLYGLLHGLQAAVAQQDTLMEARFPEGPERREKLTRANSRDGELGRSGPAPAAPDKQATELALLQRQHALLQEELRRCRRLGEERATEAGSLEARLRESEQARALLEREAEEARRQLAALGHSEPPPAEAPWARRPLDPRRRSLPAGDALYLSFTPPQPSRGHDRLDLSVTIRSIHRPFEDRERQELGSPEERLQDSSDPDTGSEEEGGSRLSPPHSPRDFTRMQDIPEETETRDGEPVASES